MSDAAELKTWAIYSYRKSHLGTYQALTAKAAYAAHCAVMGYPTLEAARIACREKTIEAMLAAVEIVEIPPWKPEELAAIRNAPAMSDAEYALAPRTEALPSPEEPVEGDDYTPGPWTVDPPSSEDRVVISSEAGKAIVGQAVGHNAAANGRLMAAAPALLKALRLARTFIGGQEAPPEGMSYDDVMLLGTLAEAEALATGQSLSDVIGEPPPEEEA